MQEQRNKFRVIITLDRDEFIALRNMAESIYKHYSTVKTPEAMRLVCLSIVHSELIKCGYLEIVTPAVGDKLADVMQNDSH